MKARFTVLGLNHKKGLSFLKESLDICALNHILSRKLLIRLSRLDGSLTAISPPWLELDQLESFNRGSQGPPGARYLDGYNTRALLVAFVQDYLRGDGNRVAVCENFGWEREHIARLVCPPPRLICYQDNEIYNAITQDMDFEEIEEGVIDRHHWQTGICTGCVQIPDGDIPHEGFFDELVQNTLHIFIPAFDGTGFLIWSSVGGAA